MIPHPGEPPEPDAEYVPVRRDVLQAAIELIADNPEHDQRLLAAGYQQGRQAHLSGGYDEGYTLGHDTGYSARQDTRAYVHGILDGFAAGTEERHRLAADLLRRSQPNPAVARQADREAEAS